MMSQKECACTLAVKLEAFGENSCRAWHKDFYVGRAITCYCGRGTEFTPSDNIQWDEAWWKDPAINRSRIYDVAAGDILFMKGASYPY